MLKDLEIPSLFFMFALTLKQRNHGILRNKEKG